MKRILLAFLLSPVLTQAQIITTVAGTGAFGYSGDSGPATMAKIDRADDVAIDGLGNLYIADVGNIVIRKVSVSGTITTIAGNGTGSYGGDGGPATAAGLYNPSGVAVDISGNVYIADEQNNRIRKVSLSGTITTIAGNGTAGYSGDGVPATATELNHAYRLAVDGAGNVYIADAGNNRIRKVDVSGIITTIAGNGTSGYSGDGLPATGTELNAPYGVTVDGSGNIYIADEGNNRIRKVNASGIISTIAGNGTYGYSGDGMPATNAELFCNGVTVDGSGNVYFADVGANRVRKISTSGIISTVAGNGTEGYSGDGIIAVISELYNPTGLIVDSTGNLYIADEGNFRIRKVSAGISIVSSLPGLSSAVNIFPNPTQNELNITSAHKITIVTINNLLGQTVHSYEPNSDKVQVDISDLPAGIYFVRINGTEVRKFVKE